MEQQQTNPDEQRIEATVARWWKIATGLRHFVGPTWDQIEADIVKRLRYNARDDGSYTDADVTAACRSLVNPRMYEVCKYPGDWIGAFARAVDDARSKRSTAERQKRLVDMTSKPISAEEKAEVHATLQKMIRKLRGEEV